MTDLHDVGSEYEALVRQAMSRGLQGLDCTLVQLPNDQNGHHGVVLAAATTERGVFRAVGEAWRDLLPPTSRSETLTTAEVRAKSRALREALGMPAAAAVSSSAVAGVNAGGATPIQEGPTPGRAPTSGARSAETATRSTVVTSASAQAHAGSTNGVPAPLGGSDSRTHQPPSGGQPVESPTASETRNERVTAVPDKRTGAELPQPAKLSQMPVDGLGPDMVSRLLEMTKRKASLEGNPAGDDEALQRLDSYFQRAFGHPLSEASRTEGQRVIQRLAADLTRAGAGQGRAATG